MISWIAPTMLTVVSCVVIYQDLKYRAVTWVFFPIIFLLGFKISYINLSSYHSIGRNLFINVIFVIIQLLLLRLIFYFKKGKEGFLNKKLGLGDILFILACSSYFSPLNFVMFYILSLIYSLLLYLIFWAGIKRPEPSTIPLAGLQSSFLIVLILASKLLSYNFSNDDWILFKLNVV
jgi:hypothetical protein